MVVVCPPGDLYSSIFLLFFFFSGKRKCVSASGIMGCRWDSGGREVRSLSSPYWQAASIDTSPSSLSTTASHARDEKGGRRYFALSPKCQDPLVTSIRTLGRGGWRKTQRRISHFPPPPHILKTVPEMRMSGSAKKGSVFVLPQQTIFSLFLRGCLPFHLFSCHRKRKRRRDGVGPNPPLPKDTRCPFASSSSV